MLETHEITPKQARSSRKEPLTDADAAELLTGVDEVRIARGRKIVRQTADDSSIDDLKGPTGNYRAPIVQVGRTLLVGFHQDTLTELVGG